MLEEQCDSTALAYCAAHRGPAYDITQCVLVGFREVVVPSDFNTDVRLRKAEVSTQALLDCTSHKCEAQHSHFWPAGRVGVEGGGSAGKQPSAQVISIAVPMAPEPHLTRVQGRQGFPGVKQRFVVQGNLRYVTWRPPIVPPDLAPLFRGAPKVSGLLGLPGTPASNFPKALLALSATKVRLRACPIVTEPLGMLWATTVNGCVPRTASVGTARRWLFSPGATRGDSASN